MIESRLDDQESMRHRNRRVLRNGLRLTPQRLGRFVEHRRQWVRCCFLLFRF